MNQEITADQVIQAARTLDRGEFTRAEVAAKLGVRRREVDEGFRNARRGGRLRRVRTDAHGTRHFRLADRQADPAAARHLDDRGRPESRSPSSPEGRAARFAREWSYLDDAVSHLFSRPRR